MHTHSSARMFMKTLPESDLIGHTSIKTEHKFHVDSNLCWRKKCFCNTFVDNLYWIILDKYIKIMQTCTSHSQHLLCVKYNIAVCSIALFGSNTRRFHKNPSDDHLYKYLNHSIEYIACIHLVFMLGTNSHTDLPNSAHLCSCLLQVHKNNRVLSLFSVCLSYI